MRTFHCDHCHNPVYFENTQCTHCGHALGLLPRYMRVSALRDLGDGVFAPLMPSARDRGERYRHCENRTQHAVCNWMVPVADAEGLCVACRLNVVIPNLARPGFHDRWRRLERSKRRLLYSLYKLGMEVRAKHDDAARGLAFSFVSHLDAPPGDVVTTGHDGGHITINIDEADPALRERNRLDLQETYRTLLGHFRHESGHHYWNLLIDGAPEHGRFRELFGDERQDYAAALERHYADGPPGDWQSRFISAYASSHPWEDWAESWAHYLHIVDTLETAAHFGVQVERELPDGGIHRAAPDFDPYRSADFAPVVANWLPLTFALNSLNRSMGLQDLYPFVMSTPSIDKLHFVHDVVQRCRDDGVADVVPASAGPARLLGRLLRVLLGRSA